MAKVVIEYVRLDRAGDRDREATILGALIGTPEVIADIADEPKLSQGAPDWGRDSGLRVLVGYARVTVISGAVLCAWGGQTPDASKGMRLQEGREPVHLELRQGDKVAFIQAADPPSALVLPATLATAAHQVAGNTALGQVLAALETLHGHTDGLEGALALVASAVKQDESKTVLENMLATLQAIAAGRSAVKAADTARIRPNNATNYAANKVIGDGVASLFTFSDFFPEAGGRGWLTKVRVAVSKAGGIAAPTSHSLRAVLFSAPPEQASAIDQADYIMSEANRSKRLTTIDLGYPRTGANGSDQFELEGFPAGGPELIQAAAGAKDLHLLLVSSGVWTPTAQSVWLPVVSAAFD